MTRFESRKRKIDWDSITKWEEDNKSLVIWALTIDCIRDRMKETDQDFCIKCGFSTKLASKNA